MQSYSPQQFDDLREDVARSAFTAAIQPTREPFRREVQANIQDLSRRGLAFGGVGNEQMRDVFNRQASIESDVAGRLGSQLGRGALSQSMSRRESELGREFSGNEAARQRGFSAEQAGLGRAFESGESELGREYSRGIEDQQRQYSRQEEDLIRQEELDNRRLSDFRAGLSSSLDRGTLSRILGGGSATSIFSPRRRGEVRTQYETDLANRAYSMGISPEELRKTDTVLGRSQAALMMDQPGQYVMTPGQMNMFQRRLAQISSGQEPAQDLGSALGMEPRGSMPINPSEAYTAAGTPGPTARIAFRI